MIEKTPLDYKSAIQSSGFDIYSSIEVGDACFWIPTPHLETLLNQALTGLDLDGLALRTRAKTVKIAVCEALGYPVPKSFKKHSLGFSGSGSMYTRKNRTTCKSGMKNSPPHGVMRSSTSRIRTSL